MSTDLIKFLFGAAVISLSGVMAPGPITAATLAAGVRRRHAGMLVALGHGVIEFPLMALLVLGLGALFKNDGFRISVGLLGGMVLVLLAVLTFMDLSKRNGNESPAPAANPLWSGIVLSAGNPYFLLWWATVGLGLLTTAQTFGLLGVVLLGIVHWLCDLFWLEVLSFGSFNGSRWFGQKAQTTIIIVCGSAMGIFGVLFAVSALRDWAGA